MRIGLIVGMMVVTPCFGQVFQGLGVVSGQNASISNAISSDGTTVVGTSIQFGGVAWRWTQATGRVDLGQVPSGFIMEQASSVSGDGSVIVGGMNDGNNSQAWRWTQPAGFVRVIGMGAGSIGPYISSDASTIVGRAEGVLSAVRWTQATGVQSLNPVTGLPFGNGSATTARAVSADGSVVVGAAFGTYQLNPPMQAATPYRWTQATGSVGILNNGQFYFPLSGAGATDISADGSVIVGNVGLGSFLWTAQSGYQLLTNDVVPPGLGLPQISADGTTMVYKWHYWTQAGGLQRIEDVLTNAGCNFTGWTNILTSDVSFNGRTLCGYGTNPAGQTEAWYATIPAPSAVVALGVVGGFSSVRRKRSSRVI